MNNNFLKVKKKIKSSYPNQYICEERGNGIICNGNFYKFVTYNYGGQLPVRKNQAYYIRTSYIQAYKTAADTRTYRVFSGYIDGVSIEYCSMNYPTLTDCGYMFLERDIRLLFDFETAPTVTQDGTITSEAIGLVYALVDKLPGEKNPKVIEQ